MADDLNLPASLERLEINPERGDGAKGDKNPFNRLASILPETDLDFQSLKLKAECLKGHCQCQRKRDKEPAPVKRCIRFKRPLLRKSRLFLLRAPVLRVCDVGSGGVTSLGLKPGGIQNVTTSSHSLVDVSSPKSEKCMVKGRRNVLSGAARDSLNGGIDSSSSSVSSLSSSSTDPSLSMSDSLTSSSLLSSNSSSPPAIPSSTSTSPPCCSVQARIPCDDTTMDELASYFDVLVHIPKKMSLMAEMMYI